jgi:hypothetical protein
MEGLAGTPDWIAVVTAAERPDLWARVEEDGRFDRVWPEYNRHGDHAGTYFGTLIPRHAHLQVLVLDRWSEEVIARGRTIPFAWDGTLADLPRGIDALGARALEHPESPTSLSALAAEVLPRRQGQGVSRVIIAAMAALAGGHQLAPLVAPVRPSWKERYPRVPIEHYVGWRRDDGLPFDPWIRVHARLGGQLLRPEPRSLEITAPVARWEAWTATRFPGDGDHTFPGGLAPLEVRGGVGHYWEPNVWVLHS